MSIFISMPWKLENVPADVKQKNSFLSPPPPKLEDTRRTDLPEHEPRRILPPGDGHSWCYILIHTADSYVCFHFPCGYCVACCERELFLSSTHLPLSTTSVFLFFFFDAMSLLLLNDATPRCFILQCPPQPRHRYRYFYLPRSVSAASSLAFQLVTAFVYFVQQSL